jgi:phosphoserine / homoserine phosphotransferase
MQLACLDLEGVIIPEIWIAVAKATGIPELEKTTRDVSDYNELMYMRLRVLKEAGIGIEQLRAVAARIDPLPGALEFLNWLRGNLQTILLSDTFIQFSPPILKKLNWPTLFCNELIVNPQGVITDFRLRHRNGKYNAVLGFKDMGFDVIAVGDSYNDIPMLMAADHQALFKAPDSISKNYADLADFDNFNELKAFFSKIISV